MRAEWERSLTRSSPPTAGDTVVATKKFVEYADPDVNVIALADFENDCVATSLALARALGDKVWGVRLDTSGTLVDRSVWNMMGTFKPTGVIPQLVFNVRRALDAEGFPDMKIVVSGGFTAARIREFERDRVPVDAYAVGSAFFEGSGKFDFTADIVAVNVDGSWRECHKVGRPERINPSLEPVPQDY